MYTNLTLENFRNFSKLDLHDFKSINIITGVNGAGKTAVLEAISLNAGACNPAEIVQLNNFRGETLSQYTNDRFFKSVFHDASGKRTAQLIGRWKNNGHDTTPSIRELTIRSIPAVWKYTRLPEGSDGVSGLELDFKGGGTKAVARLYWLEEALNQQTNALQSARGNINPGMPISYRVIVDAPNTRASISCMFLTQASRDVQSFVYTSLVNATREKNISAIVGLANIVDKRVTNLVPLSENSVNSVYVDVGLNKLIPLTMMGAGFSNILQIACGIIQPGAEIVIVDEIEDGLHYTTFPDLANALIDFVLSRRTQFFVTTHSGEFLDAFVDVARSRLFDDVCSYRLSNKPVGAQVTRFDSQDLANAKQIDLDLR